MAAALLAGLTLAPGAAAKKGAGHGAPPGASPEQHNMRLVGLDNLQGRAAYQPIVHELGRYILYVGHHNGRHFNPLTGMDEPNGTSIVDVTNPRHPVYLHHLPADGGAVSASGRGQAQMVRACNGDDLPNGIPGRTYLLRANGRWSHQVWDVTDPANPRSW